MYPRVPYVDLLLSYIWYVWRRSRRRVNVQNFVIFLSKPNFMFPRQGVRLLDDLIRSVNHASYARRELKINAWDDHWRLSVKV